MQGLFKQGWFPFGKRNLVKYSLDLGNAFGKH